MNLMLNINIKTFRDTKKFNVDDKRFREIEFESEYNNEFEINIVEVNANRRLLKFDDDNCD